MVLWDLVAFAEGIWMGVAKDPGDHLMQLELAHLMTEFQFGI